MTDNQNPTSSDWISKTLAAIDSVSGYTFSALAIAGALVLFLPSPFLGIDFSPIKKEYGGWIGAGVIACIALAMAKTIRSLHATIATAWLNHKAKRAQRFQQSDVLAYLDTLSEGEKLYLLPV